MRNNCIEEVPEPSYCVNPLTVAEGKKLRLVLDLRHVNKYLERQKFKYENLKTVSILLENDYYFATFDLKSGYHHISIAEDHRQFLGFSWGQEFGRIRYFQFLVMPFGLGSACYAFTKTTRPLVQKWRGLGTRCSMYLDDGMLAAEQYERVRVICENVTEDLKCAGFTLNKKKSNLFPSQKGQFLGFNIDTRAMEFSVPEKKIEHILQQIGFIMKLKLVTAHKIAKIAGHIISMSLGIGPIARLFTRGMYKFIDDRLSWYSLSSSSTVEVNGRMNQVHQ